jgi:hypothetical protein
MFRCDNAQNILDSIDQQIVRAKSDAFQARQANQSYIDSRDAAYTAKLRDLKDGSRSRSGTAGGGGASGPPGLLTHKPSGLAHSTFGTNADEEEPVAFIKGRKSVS